jgi:ABC-type sugar transport system substrate-binding protein
MEQNQGLYADVLASIPDNEILEATVGNVTNSQVAQTADNLIRKYPDLKP